MAKEDRSMRLQSPLFALALALAAPALAAPGGQGTDILHLTVRSAFEGTGVDADAAGGVAASLRQQGNADIQKLQLEVAGLAPDAGYTLWALLRGAVDPVEALAFDTDANGEASLKLMKNGVPMALDPLVDVLALEIRNEGDEVVLEADLSDPDFLQYLVKRRLDNDGVDGDAAGGIMLKAGPGHANLRLSATGLDPNTDYTLVIDGAPLVTLSSDAAGRLKDKRDLPGGPADALDVELLELRNGADQSVLSTELP
jgi:hypothetical protein